MRFLVLLLLLNCGIFHTPSPEEEIVKDASVLVENMLNPKDVDSLQNNPVAFKVAAKSIKNTLAFCEKTIAKKEREAAADQKTIKQLQKENKKLQEELADAREKSGQVDFINKILMVAAAIGLGWMLIQFLPIIKRLVGLG